MFQNDFCVSYGGVISLNMPQIKEKIYNGLGHTQRSYLIMFAYDSLFTS